MRMTIIPNFYIIGSPKAGTTAMSEYLRKHPQVFFSNPKEPQYFASDFNNGGRIGNFNEYLALFSKASPEHKVIAEGSTKYLRSVEAIKRIEAFSPNAKYLVMIRNPLEMVVSLHEQVLFNGDEEIQNFIDAWFMQDERRNGRSIPKHCQEPLDLQYGYFCLLGEQLAHLYSIVDAHRVKVIFYDDFVEDNAAIYSELLQFLNLSPFSLPAYERINQGKRTRYSSIKHMARLMRIAKNFLRIKHKFGMIQKINILNSTASSRQNLPQQYRLELINYFQYDIQLLSKITGRDLNYWMKS